MPSFCAVLKCNDKYGHADSISFHKFPFKREDLLQKWLDFARRGPNWQPSKWSAICSRHFRDDDFNCSNERKTLKKTAIPTIVLALNRPEQEPIEPTRHTPIVHKIIEPSTSTHVQGTADKLDDYVEEEEQLNSVAHSSPNTPKVNCRLCGHAAVVVVTFTANFEIYGMLQKCFPTLNIQQDDNLPKEICRNCLKSLENFSRFIDKVLETQSELQRKWRSEKPNNKVSLERQSALKIKQEPVVRVKQEVAEGFESFLSDDLDMAVDEACEHEAQDSTAVEQKYQFCDFPLLNSQDIINNCDIMEIINLDDPFINIPDDDANTTCDNVETQQPPKQLLPTAHELLQTHLLIEEHNYAYAADDFKEEWQIKNYYKTEKTEGYETSEDVDDVGHNDHEEDYQTYAAAENAIPTQPSIAEFKTPALPVYDAMPANCNDNRSAKPIVTSVSAIAESRLQFPLASKKHDMQSSARSPYTKPNIVVLNESIVKSSSAFQLHACGVCQLKFFTVESLAHHHAMAHSQSINAVAPMVSVPSGNISFRQCPETTAESCKLEEDGEKQTTNNNWKSSVAVVSQTKPNCADSAFEATKTKQSNDLQSNNNLISNLATEVCKNIHESYANINHSLSKPLKTEMPKNMQENLTKNVHTKLENTGKSSNSKTMQDIVTNHRQEYNTDDSNDLNRQFIPNEFKSASENEIGLKLPTAAIESMQELSKNSNCDKTSKSMHLNPAKNNENLNNVDESAECHRVYKNMSESVSPLYKPSLIDAPKNRSTNINILSHNFLIAGPKNIAESTIATNNSLHKNIGTEIHKAIATTTNSNFLQTAVDTFPKNMQEIVTGHSSFIKQETTATNSSLNKQYSSNVTINANEIVNSNKCDDSKIRFTMLAPTNMQESVATVPVNTETIKFASKNHINILEMQQTFLKHQSEHYFTPQNMQNNNRNCTDIAPNTVNSTIFKHPNSLSTFPFKHSTILSALQLHRNNSNQIHTNMQQNNRSNNSHAVRKNPLSEPTKARKGLKRSSIVVAKNCKVGKLKYATKPANSKLDAVTAFTELRRRYRKLQLKCKSLQRNVNRPPSTNLQSQQNHKVCQICHQHFATIMQLLRHKQIATHNKRKPIHFSATCCGCEKHFRTRLALNQHMRYICQSLSLRWFKTKLQTFKCRHCCSITFTHWRLYRRHELKCKQKLLAQKRKKQSLKACEIKKVSSPKSNLKRKSLSQRPQHTCIHCHKVFAHARGLRQHEITHTEQRTHKCNICTRVFKRRNGLMQHVRGFHMQLKPFACPVCQHCYALKCDMLRCRHSLRIRHNLVEQHQHRNDVTKSSM